MDLVLEGAREKGLLNPDGSMPPEVADRLNSELIVFRRLGMVGYALLVGEFIKWAKSRGIIVGPGRGSAAGSLIDPTDGPRRDAGRPLGGRGTPISFSPPPGGGAWAH